MKDENKTKGQLISELEELRQRIGEFEALEAERKRAEEALLESEAKYSTLVQQTMDGVVIAQDGEIKLSNRGMAQISGYSIEEMMGMPFLDMIEPDCRDVVVQRQKARVTGEEVEPMMEVRIRCKDGSTKDIESSTATIQYQSKPALVVVVRDVTERKRAEEELQQAYEQESKLREELQREMRRRVEFTRGLVHELKTPVTAMVASSGLLVEELPEGSLLRLAKNIERSTLNLDKRIGELLDVARGELGLLKLNRTQVDLLKMLRSVAVEMDAAVSSRKQSVALELPSSLSSVWADEGRLREVVLNLLGNACRFTPKGGRIALRAREDNDNLVVEVEDNGPGIAKKNQERIFEAYYRVEAARGQPDGLGLGLALCKRLIESHGGMIWVKSRKGKGSTFGFSVPLRAASG